jgi:protein-cysteine N-palmitoyltransferase HHAT
MPPATTRRSPRLAQQQQQQQDEEQQQQHSHQQQTRRRSSRAAMVVATPTSDAQLPQQSPGSPPRRVFVLSGLELAAFAGVRVMDWPTPTPTLDKHAKHPSPPPPPSSPPPSKPQHPQIVAYCLIVLFREGDRLCKAVLRELPPAVIARAGLRPVPSSAAASAAAPSSSSLSTATERLLSFGSDVNDLSDAQWRDFRGSAPLLAAVLAGFVLLSRAARAWDDRHAPSSPSSSSSSSLRLGARTRLLALLGIAFLAVLHGAAAPLPLLLCLASFEVAHRCAGREPWGLWAVWTWHVGVFFAVRATDGLPLSALPLGLGERLAFLDARRGPLRWHIHYNLLLLRMVSHAADLHWARLAARGGAERPLRQQQEPAAAVTAAVAAGLPLTRRRRRALERAAAERHLPPAAYASPVLYLAYCLYPPLYIAGPIATFNALGAQMLPAQGGGGGGGEEGGVSGGGRSGGSDGNNKAASLTSLSSLPLPTAREIALYALRALACWLVLEAVTHRLFFWAIVRAGLWRRLAEARGAEAAAAAAARAAAAAAAGDAAAQPPPQLSPPTLAAPAFLPPLQMALVPWWVMLFAWLKFLALWRFFRAFALADGASAAPENLTRCICNNYDVAGFWQNWHASYNRWLVRYMYVPMGGARRRILNVWPIFTFVAIWHDLEIKMLAWAWLMCLLIAPEAFVKHLGSRAGWPFPDKQSRSFRYACAAAGAANVVLLMAANMVGFVFGSLEGAGTFLRRVVADRSFGPVVAGAFFCGVQLMFALRDWERWREAREREEEEVVLVGREGGGGGGGGGKRVSGGGGGTLAMAALGARRRGGGGKEDDDDEEEQARGLLLSAAAGGGRGTAGGAV